MAGCSSSGVSIAVVSAVSTFDRSSDRLVRNALLLGAVPAVVVAVLVALFTTWWLGLIALVLVAAVWVGVVLQRVSRSVATVLDLIGAPQAGTGGYARWENIVDGLCASSGVTQPELVVLDHTAANALVVADRQRVVLVVTKGLAEGLSQIELEAVGANLFGRIRGGAARFTTLSVGLPGPTLASSSFVTRTVAEGLGDQQSVRSDLAAVDLTRYPPGVARALRAMDRIGTHIEGVAPVTAHLWLAPVVAPSAVDESVAVTALQPLDLRIAVMDEL